MNGDRLTYTVPEAAHLLGVSRGVAYEAARSGDIPAIRIGRRLLVPRARLIALLNDGDPQLGQAADLLDDYAEAGGEDVLAES